MRRPIGSRIGRVIQSALAVCGLIGFAKAGAAAPASSALRFDEVAAQVGIQFTHEDGHSGLKHFVETASAGGGWIDYDQDGKLDLYLINGAETPGRKLTIKPQNRLFRNVGNGFQDVTDAAGVGDTGYGMGMCVGDVDGDGLVDFMVTNFGPDRLYRNKGQGRFEEIGTRAGVADPRWSTGCAFADLDGDADLDLYVARYTRFQFEQSPFCGDRARSIRSYCNPSAFRGEVHSLYINDGKGKFKDEAAQRGIHQRDEDRGFSVVASDLDVDGDIDLYVANDGSMNRLYRNQGQGKFIDEGLISGTGLNGRGLAEAGMGADVADVDGNGLPDLLVTNFSMEANTLYLNMGQMQFEDATARFDLTTPSFAYVGWGIQFLDADNDTDLDFAIVNGHPIDNIELFESSLSWLQPKQLFENVAGKRFVERTGTAGSVWQKPRSGRGLAAGDYDDDGRLDLLVNNSRDKAELLHNQSKVGNWIGFRLIGKKPNVLAIGAAVTIKIGNKQFRREVLSGGGFLVQRDLRLHFGLADANGPISYIVTWPNGSKKSGSVKELNRYVPITQD